MRRMMLQRWFSGQQTMIGLILVAGTTAFIAAGCGESPVDGDSKQQVGESTSTADKQDAGTTTNSDANGSGTTTSSDGNGSDTK
jgi:hypothetical protein